MLYTEMMNYTSLPENIVVSFRRTAKLIKKRPPHVDWMALVMGFIKPNHEIFQKHYVAPKPQRKNAVEPYMVDNEDGFYDNLPETEG